MPNTILSIKKNLKENYICRLFFFIRSFAKEIKEKGGNGNKEEDW